MSVSICIPTRDRPHYLKRCLESLTTYADSSWQILVSDNSSSDGLAAETKAVTQQFGRIDYVRQSGLLDAQQSHRAALQAGAGHLRVYLADDDFLIPAPLREALHFMDQHPEVSVAFAPWEVWDDEAKHSHGASFHVRRGIYGPAQRREVFQVICSGVWPEIAVWRGSAVDHLDSSPYAYGAFLTLTLLLQAGRKVAFLPEPFYRFSVGHHGDGRGQAGDSLLLAGLDAYRGGLELLAPSWGAEEREAVDRFMRDRYRAAARVLLGKGRTNDAYLLRWRGSLSDINPETGLRENEYHFYRCQGCQGLLTVLQVRATLPKEGHYCACGSRRAAPSWPVWWEWAKPSVVWLSLLIAFSRMPKCV